MNVSVFLGTGDELEEGEIPEISVDAPAAVRNVVQKATVAAGLHTLTKHKCNICNVSAMSQGGLDEHFKCEWCFYLTFVRTGRSPFN